MIIFNKSNVIVSNSSNSKNSKNSSKNYRIHNNV